MQTIYRCGEFVVNGPWFGMCTKDVCCLAEYTSSYESIDYTSRPIAAAVQEEEQTLLQALRQILPQCFEATSTATSDKSTTAESAQASTEDPSTTSAEAASKEASSMPRTQAAEKVFDEQYAVIICGIKPSLQTPLAGLHAMLHAPDLFLYITVIALR